MIYWVDEHIDALDPWVLDLRERGLEVEAYKAADEAFVVLCRAPADAVDLVIIDVMLAVSGQDATRFSRERTLAYLETGLCLLEDLCPHNPDVFPDHAIFLTNTTDATTLAAADAMSDRLGVPVWKKSDMYSPEDFGDRVQARLRRLSG
jgi:DNA-binding NarL/FixJ family response regulator